MFMSDKGDLCGDRNTPRAQRKLRDIRIRKATMSRITTMAAVLAPFFAAANAQAESFVPEVDRLDSVRFDAGVSDLADGFFGHSIWIGPFVDGDHGGCVEPVDKVHCLNGLPDPNWEIVRLPDLNWGILISPPPDPTWVEGRGVEYLSIVPIPEPSGSALLLLGSCACLGWRRFRCQQSDAASLHLKTRQSHVHRSLGVSVWIFCKAA